MAEKKLKKLSKKTTAKSEDTAKVIKDSASQIWLAGLGAFAKAQEEGGKIFDALVKEGMDMETKTRKVTEAKVHEVKSNVGGAVGQAQSKAGKSWDKLEQVFEERVAKALNALGVPTSKDVQQLTKRVEELQKTVDEYNKNLDKKPVVHKTATKKATTRKTAAKKTTAKK